MRDGFRKGLRRAIGAGGLTLAFCLAGAPAVAQIQVVSAGAEYETFHPRPVAKAPAANGEDFQATMDRVFGAGRWRKTSGYRTQAQENALRRQGAGTVAPGHVSLHSIGHPDAPSAYDAVVDGHVSPVPMRRRKLRSASGRTVQPRVLAEGKHGPQGAHRLATSSWPRPRPLPRRREEASYPLAAEAVRRPGMDGRRANSADAAEN